MAKSENTLLTFVIVNRNTADLLIRCLEFIFRSDLPENPQTIVVDNGSTDDSVSRLRSAFPGVEVIEAGRNLGFAAANNRAFEKTEGRYLMLVNTDALLEKGLRGQASSAHGIKSSRGHGRPSIAQRGR